jgi:outer membrane receptor protein involved in Fe transport
VTRGEAATFTPEEKASAANSVVIDEAAIRGVSSENLTELLRDLGFATEAAPTDYDENVTLLRGFGTEHLNTEVNGNVLILIDGRRSGISSARQILLGNVERVEIVRGPAMYKYSMGSPGGIINVVTKRGGPRAVSGSVNFGAGSYKTYKASAAFNGLASGLDYSLGYSHGATGEDYKDGDGKKVHNTNTDGTDNMFLSLGYAFNETHRLGIGAYYHKVDKAHQPSYVDDEGDVQAASYANRKSEMFSVNYEGATPGRQWSWHAGLGYGKDLFERYSNQPFHRVQEVETKLVNAGLSYSSDLLDLSGGFDFVHYGVENAGEGATKYYVNTNWPRTRHKTSESGILGIYLVGTLKTLQNSLNLTGALRFERSEAKDKSVGDEDWANYTYFTRDGITRRDQLPAKRSFSHLSPAVGISYQPVDWFLARANYTQGWRAPSGRQLFASRRTEGYGAGGDPRLKPEKTDSFEFGFDVKVPNFNFSGTYFFQDIKDFIYIYYYADPTGANPNRTGRVMRNVDRRYQVGFEAQTSANVAGLMGYDTFSLTPYVNVTHLTKREEQIKKGAAGMDGWWWPITRMPDTAMTFGVRFSHFASHFNANLSFIYNGLRIPGRGNASPNEHFEDMEFGKTTVANLSLSKRVWEFSNDSYVTIKLNVNNIFDKVYSYRDKVPDTYAYPGRNYFASISYDF